jgi:hypothetical protein
MQSPPDSQKARGSAPHFLDAYKKGRCNDCGVRTTPRFRFARKHEGTWEWYLVQDDLWARTGISKGFLCIGCLEQRIGRQLRPDDFSTSPVNDPHPFDTRRLGARKAGAE